MAFCLDTDVIIEFFRGNARVVQRLTEKINKNEPLFVTHITLCELFRGTYLSNNPHQEESKINALLNACEILDFSLNTDLTFGRLSAQLMKQGKNIGDADLLIGSIALTHQCVLVTNNTKHFEVIEQLKLENWQR